MKLRTLCLAALLACMAAVHPTPVLADDESPITEASESKIILDTRERIQIEDFLRAMDAILDAELVWDPQDKAIRGKSITAGGLLEMDPKNLVREVQGLLTFYDLVLVPLGKNDETTAKRLLVMDARRTSQILKLKAEYVSVTDRNVDALDAMDGRYITTAIPVEHLTDLRAARGALQRIVTAQNIGNVTEVPGSRAFIVTDFAPNVAAIYRLVRQMDATAARSTKDLVVKTVYLRNGNALTCAAALDQLFGGSSTAPVAPSRGRTPEPMPYGGPTLRIVPDVRTNTVTVRGTQDRVQEVLATLSSLDEKVEAQARVPVKFSLLVLEHADPAQLASVLTNTIRQRKEMFHGATPPPGVTAVPQANAILLSGSAEALAQLEALTKSIDAKAGARSQGDE